MTRYFTLFTENQIFSDPQLNVFCNQLYTFLINKIEEQIVINEFVLDGAVALLLQNVEPAQILNIKFSTTSKTIFEFLKASGSSLDVISFKIEKNLIILRSVTAYVEVHFQERPISAVNYSGLKLKNKVEILKNK